MEEAIEAIVVDQLRNKSKKNKSQKSHRQEGVEEAVEETERMMSKLKK
jgi:hypothetical protein